MQFQVMAKPSGSRCNLGCSYCFYTEKKSLYPHQKNWRMPPEVLASFIKQSLECHDGPECHFNWQGGEPTLLGVEYFKNIIRLQKKYAGNKHVTNSLQTNATLLTDEWCRFLKHHDFLVGVSIDGPKALHDRYRIKRNGKATFEQVMSGITRLKKHRVPFNTLTVINSDNARYPLKVYRFLSQIGDGHMQFIPAVERLPDQTTLKQGLELAPPPCDGSTPDNYRITPWSVEPQQLATFYTTLFDYWVRNDIGKIFVQFFEVALGNWLGAGAGLCQFSPTCGMAAALEHNGDLYSCDHYVYPEHKLGNIMQTPLRQLIQSEAQQQFGNAKLTTLPPSCLSCEVRPACHGDCPKHRFVKSAHSQWGISYLCPAYRKIFSHMAPYLDGLGRLIQSGRVPGEMMTFLRQREI
ncbi:anaerobic sulfatase maturase [Endozoicomonas sp. Mp262]|uniref:anaerobic sulfatase maturase n=1 Tax=Endozoicomonas sp. Mp262 TaxID=2919499 RepID=UPI0021D961AD